METTKICFKCRLEQPLEQFYRHPMMADGRLGKCQSCTRRDVRLNRLTRRAQYNEYDRARGDRKSYVYDEKFKARQAVRKAVRKSVLVRPTHCSVCLVEGKVEGHHQDYGRPLDVVWVCSLCHGDIHAKEKIG